MTATPARESVSSVALIGKADAAGRRLWLARWNEHWAAYNFVAGHRRPEESFRQCMLREITEDRPLPEEKRIAWFSNDGELARLRSNRNGGRHLRDRPG